MLLQVAPPALRTAGRALVAALLIVPVLVLAALVGAVTVGTFGITVVMGQEYLPGRIGLAAGVTMGLSIGLGGVGAPLLGFLADKAGLSVTMLVIAALPVLGLILSFTLPRKVPISPRT